MLILLPSNDETKPILRAHEFKLSRTEVFTKTQILEPAIKAMRKSAQYLTTATKAIGVTALSERNNYCRNGLSECDSLKEYFSSIY